MNLILNYLRANRERLKLEELGIPEVLSSLILTPRFRASRHLVFLIMPHDDPTPVLVAKIPRLLDASDGLAREAANLRELHQSRPGGLDSVPRLIAYESFRGWPLLLETALIGPLLAPASIRQDRQGACDAVVGWLLDVQQATCHKVDRTAAEPLIEASIMQFASVFPLSPDEERLVECTRALVAPLYRDEIWSAVEHGDLSHPNIVRIHRDRVGVVDWELAEPEGLLAQDLFFFLSYAGFASRRAKKPADYQTAFQDAFFGATAWALPYVRRYAEAFRLSEGQLTALFVACWARYIAGLFGRLQDDTAQDGQHALDTANWLRSNRYFELWKYAVNHADNLRWA